jgi:hypothetical protein
LRRTTLIGLAGLAGAAIVGGLGWQSRQWFGPSLSSSPSTSLAHSQTPTAPLAERLDLKPQTFQLNVDPNGLLNDSQSAIDDVKRQVRSVPSLRGRSVGLAIVYSGAPDQASTERAQAVSGKIYQIFQSLAHNGEPFQRASYYDNLSYLGISSNLVRVDAFLFTR